MARLATQQHGVVARSQLVTIGFADRTIERWLSIGRLHRVHRGVYAVGSSQLNQRGHWLAAVLACGEGAVLSHTSAAALWGLVGARTAVMDVTSPRGNQGRRRWGSVRLHRGRLALRPIRRLLTEAGASTKTRSPLEDRFAAFCRTHHLPPPVANVLVLGHEVDALWPAQRLVVEMDSFAFHRHRAAFERDRARDAALQAAGYRVIRITHRRLEQEPGAVATQLRALLAANVA